MKSLMHAVEGEMGSALARSHSLATVIALAAILPLRRALRVHPNIALRAE